MFIYLLRNITDGKCYVGQTTAKCPDARVSYHRKMARRAPKDSDMVIVRAIRKHGWSAFSRHVLEVCDSLEDLNAAEVFWIEFYNCMVPSGYNVKGGGRNGRVSEATKLRLSLANKGKVLSAEHRAKIASASAGRQFSDAAKTAQREAMATYVASEETRRKISLTSKGRACSEEHKVKISEANRGRTAGEKSYSAKLTWEKVREIRRKYAGGEGTTRSLGTEYGVSDRSISAVVRRETWREDHGALGSV